MQTDAELAAQVMQRIEALAQITDEPGRLTRTYGSPAMRRANDLVAGWMREAGMTTEEDAIGNLIGHYPAGPPGAKTFLLGSHLDTVRDAGRFDGALGVLAALACVRKLHSQNLRLPFALDVIGFADEEGVRFQSTYLGSRVLAGTFDFADLKRVDADGVPLREAILRYVGDPDELLGARRDATELLGYAELHIEQGPVLESKQLPVGVVSGIAGQTRIKAAFNGRAGHAGTTPMSSRFDALAAAAQFIVAAEQLGRNGPGLVVTIGEISVEPGAGNVIPGRARFTVDVRHGDDAMRESACQALLNLASRVSAERLERFTRQRVQAVLEQHAQPVSSTAPKPTLPGLLVDSALHNGPQGALEWETVQSTDSVSCSPQLSALLKEAAARHVPNVIELPSGAGHDAAALAAITPVAMLFVRCKDGISHHPDESAQEADVRVAISVMGDFLERLAERHA